jgi:hypothetical protein
MKGIQQSIRVALFAAGLTGASLQAFEPATHLFDPRPFTLGPSALPVSKPDQYGPETAATRYQKALDSISASAAQCLEALHSAVLLGTEEEGWTEETKRVALRYWILKLPDAFTDRHWRFIAQPDEEVQFPKQSRAFRQWAHLQALNEYRRKILIAYAAEIMPFVEKTWLEAHNESDLTPAKRALSALADRSTGFWYSSRLTTAIPHRASDRPPPIEAKMLESPLAEAFTASYIFTGKPFYIPSADSQPEELATAWLIMQKLKKWPLAFFDRPRIAERLAQFDTEYHQAVRAQVDGVEHDLVADASPDQLRRELEYLDALLLPEMPKVEVPTRLGDARLFDVWTRLPYYLDVLSDFPDGPLEGPRISAVPAWQSDFQVFQAKGHAVSVLGWWRISGLPNSQVSHAATSLDETTLAHLPPSLRAAYAHWQETPTPQSNTKLPSVLVTIINMTVAPEVETAGRQVFSAWEKLDASTAPSRAAPQPWVILARQPGAIPLFKARDLDARKSLSEIIGAPVADEQAESLAETFEKALESSLQTDATLAKMGRILALDSVVAALPDYLHNRYLSYWLIFTRAGRHPEEIAKDCRLILREMSSPAFASFAAQRLKEASARVRAQEKGE